MKKVKMLTTLADAKRVAFPGSVIEVDEQEATDLVDGGFAELVEPDPEVVEGDGKKAAAKKAGS